MVLDIGTDASNLIITDGGKIIGQLADNSGGDEFGLVLQRGSKLTAPVSAAVDALRTDGTCVPLAELRGQPLTAVAGIARPGAFFTMLRAAGLTLAETIALPDHYDFNSWSRFPDKRQGLIWTEKDALKLWRQSRRPPPDRRATTFAAARRSPLRTSTCRPWWAPSCASTAAPPPSTPATTPIGASASPCYATSWTFDCLPPSLSRGC